MTDFLIIVLGLAAAAFCLRKSQLHGRRSAALGFGNRILRNASMRNAMLELRQELPTELELVNDFLDCLILSPGENAASKRSNVSPLAMAATPTPGSDPNKPTAAEPPVPPKR